VKYEIEINYYLVIRVIRVICGLETTSESLIIMELILNRIAKKREYSIGRLYVRNELGKAYVCDTLEPSVNPTCHKNPKAIPTGRYAVVITLSPRFQQWLPLLLNVPRREGIRIHAGNTALDTRGCILVGENRTVGHVHNSRKALAALIQRMKERPDGEGMWITVE